MRHFQTVIYLLCNREPIICSGNTYIGFIHYPLPQNNGNLTLTFFGGNYHIFLLDNNN